jgi:hypothetical protein
VSNKDVEAQAAAEEALVEEEALAEAEVAAAAATQAKEVVTSKITAAGGSRAAKKAAKMAAKEAARREKAAKAAALAALEKERPKLAAILKDLPWFTPEVRATWLERFKSTALTEEEVLAIVAPPKEPKASKRRSTLRERLIVARHGIRRWFRSQHLLFRLMYTAGWLYLLISSASKGAWSRLTILSVAFVVIGKTRFVMRDMHPKNMQIVDRGYNERKLLLQNVLETAQRWYATPPTTAEIDRYRRDALTLVAAYVRDHRARFGSREILANLCVRDGDQIVVIGRSDGLRPVPKSYARDECTLVAKAIETGEPQLTGDLYGEFPNTIPGKSYSSILVLPVWYDGAVVAAVSIDSQEKYHFHLDFDGLQIHLSPYVQLLALALPKTQDEKRVPLQGVTR